MGYGYNCCCRNGLDELMIPPLNFLVLGVFNMCRACSFCVVFVALGLLPPPPFLYFALLMIYECHELPSHDQCLAVR